MTEKAERILEAIKEHWDTYGSAPTIRWLTDEAGISSTSVTLYHVRALEQQGLLTIRESGSGTPKIMRPSEREPHPA